MPRGGQKINMAGQQVGCWTILREAPRPDAWSKTMGAYWLCQCACGNEGDYPALDRQHRAIPSWLRQAGVLILVLIIGVSYGAKPIVAMQFAAKSNSRIIGAATYQNQLPNEQTGLNNRNHNQAAGERSEPPRIISDPLRFEGEFFINKRFFLTLMFFFLGLGVSAWSGKYLADKRYALGASLIGCGCLLGVCSWGVGFLGWFL